MQRADVEAMVRQALARYLPDLSAVSGAPGAGAQGPPRLVANISARHCHLNTQAVQALFGKRDLEVLKPLYQEGAFAAAETVAVFGPRKQMISNVRVLGPLRDECQVELASTEARFLGIDAPIRLSGSIEDTPGCYLVGPAGGLDLANPEGLPTAGATGNSIADLNYDGYLDIVFSSLYDDSSNDIPSYIYWGSSTGFFAGSRQELPTLGAVVNFIADLDTDGYLDIIFANHQQDAATFEVDSYIYWGSSTGFSEGDRDVLPALGPSGVTAAGPGIPVLRSTP